MKRKLLVTVTILALSTTLLIGAGAAAAQDFRLDKARWEANFRAFFLIPSTNLLFNVTGAASAQKGLVTTAFLKADDARPRGPCPITVNFSGYIKTAGPGTVTYTFTRSDGATSPVYTLEFKEAGSQSVTTAWTLGDANALPAYEGWQAIKVLSPNPFESSQETGRFSIKCESTGKDPNFARPNPTGNGVSPSARQAPPSNPRDEAGTFRVTLLGFVVNHETRDTLLETDGKRDEVFQVPVVLFYDRDTGLTTRSFSVFGPVFGDTNNHPTYQQAGSASARGGLRTGDAFPDASPWKGLTPAGPGFGFPSILFEGELRPIHNAAVIIPSLWEWDGNQELFNQYMDSIERALPTIRINVARALSVDARHQFRPRGGAAFGLESAVTLDERIYDRRNRPIGMARPATAPSRFTFQPEVLLLTYEGARDAVTRDVGFGPGVIEVRYDEPRDLEGSYSLYFKVERVG
ncbi:MAG TPA: hypothetical protein VFZ40_18680 [Pyrinomonadaceae bacterium]